MKTLLLFNYDWDAAAYQRLAKNQGQVWNDMFAERGFDLFSFPSNAHLIGFDIDRFVQKLARQAKRQGWGAVSSQQEQFGALAAALLAEKMGWPGTPAAAVVACQHKYHARKMLQTVCPEANTTFMRLPAAYGEPAPAGLIYPVFVKPVKAAFSVLARVVHSREELHEFTRFGVFELWVIKRLVEPFDRVAKRLLPLADIGGEAGTAHCMILEDPINTPTTGQYNLDGYVFAGQMQALGVVDSIMYPGTQAFMRFDYPSQLSHPVQALAADVARRFLQAVGFTHGLFNMEFFYDAVSQKLTVIEFNPRMASQFSDLYWRVDGIDLHAIALALAQGKNPRDLARQAPKAKVATSAVYRVFDNTQPLLPQQLPPMPRATQIHALQTQFPDHLLLTFPKAKGSSARDFKWLGSYRYGILHLGGENWQDLQARCEEASRILGWPLPFSSPQASSLSP